MIANRRFCVNCRAHPNWHVVLDVTDFQKMRESFEIWDDLRTAEAELDAGRGIPHAQVMSELDDELQDLRKEMGL